LTIRQLYREFAVAKQRIDEDFDRDVRLAWSIAAFQRQEKLPDLKTLLAHGKPLSQTESDRRAVIDEFRGRHGLTSKRVRLIRRDVVH
jgi:hypothetical protein